MELHPVGAELFHADRRTDRHNKANSRFSQFCEEKGGGGGGEIQFLFYFSSFLFSSLHDSKECTETSMN